MAAEKMIPLSPLPPAPQQKVDSPEAFSNKAEAFVAAQVKLAQEVNTGIVPAHNSLVEPVNKVIENLPNISTVAGISAQVVSVADISPQVQAVDGVKGQVVRVATSADRLDRVHTSIAAVDTVNAHVANVDTLAVNMPNVDVVAGISPAVSTVAGDHDMLTRIDGQTPMLTRVDDIRADVITVSQIASAVSTVAADHDTLATITEALPIIGRVEADLAHVVAVDNMAEAVKQTALHRTNIAAVGAGMDDVSAVADSLPSVDAVKNELPHVKTVSGHIANVDAVGRNIASVREVDYRMQLIIDSPANAATAATAAQEAARQAALAKQHADSAAAVSGLPAATDQNDMQPVVWNKDKREFDFGTPGGANLVPAPAITIAAQLPVGFDTQIILTGLVGLVGTTIDSFQLQLNDGDLQDLTATNNSYTGVIKAQGIDSAVWTIKARSIDSKGNVSLWNQTTAVLVVPSVNTPSIRIPMSNSIIGTNGLNIIATEFATSHMQDEPKAARWIVSSDVEGNNVLHDSGWIEPYNSTFSGPFDPVLEPNSTVFLHVQYEGKKLGQSARSLPVEVKTSYVVKPSIIEPAVNTLVGTDKITMRGSDFQAYAGNFDKHAQTRWLVTTDVEGNNALHDSGWVSDHLTEYTATLSPIADPSSPLCLWVQYKGATLGISERSNCLSVTTGSLVTPSVQFDPASGYCRPNVALLQGSVFAPVVGATDTLKGSYVQFANDELFTDIFYSDATPVKNTRRIVDFSVLPRAMRPTQGSTVFARIKYEGELLGQSGWSLPVSSEITTVLAPTITAPSVDASGVAVNPLITCTPIVDTGGFAIPTYTWLQISKNSNFKPVVYDTGTLQYTLSHKVVTKLSPAVKYYVRMSHECRMQEKPTHPEYTDYFSAPWSATVAFTTGQVQAPTITSPVPDAFILPTTFSFVGSNFTSLGISDSLKSVTIQVAKDIAFTNKVYDQKTVTTSSTVTVTMPAQPQGTALFVRALYEGALLGDSEWSAATKIVVTTVAAPAIISPANNATNVDLTPTISVEPFSCTGNVDTASKTRIQLSTSPTFATINWDSGEIPYTVGPVTAVQFAKGTVLYARAVHYGVSTGVTTWGLGSKFTISARSDFSTEKQFLAPGSFSFTVPGDCTKIRVLCVAQGGYGANSERNQIARGGKGGGIVSAVVNVTPGQVIPLTIGGTTKFGSWVTCTGGSPTTRGTYSLNGVAQTIMTRQGAPEGKMVDSFLQFGLDQWYYKTGSVYPGGAGGRGATSGSPSYKHTTGYMVGGTGGTGSSAYVGSAPGGGGGGWEAQGAKGPEYGHSGSSSDGIGGHGGGGGGGGFYMQDGAYGGTSSGGGTGGQGGSGNRDGNGVGGSATGGTGAIGANGGNGGIGAHGSNVGTPAGSAGWGGEGGSGGFGGNGGKGGNGGARNAGWGGGGGGGGGRGGFGGNGGDSGQSSPNYDGSYPYNNGGGNGGPGCIVIWY